MVFYAKIAPQFDGKAYEIPPPTLCWECREQRRLHFRNDRNYYPRTCDLCCKNIISLYSPDHVQNVYCLHCWWSDKWDETSYGMDIDFSKKFSEQYAELFRAVPKIAMMNDNGVQSINCEFTTDFAFGKNCYLVLSSWFDEDCMFGFQTNHAKNCLDTTFVNYSQFMYDCIACENSYGCQYCQQCSECRDCIWGYDLKNCSDCLLCSGIRSKQYCILNVQYSRDEFFQKKKEMHLESAKNRQMYAQQFADFIIHTPRQFAHLINCEDSTGDTLVRCKNAHNCFYFSDLHDCKFMTNGDTAKDCYDCNSTGKAELAYNCITPDNSYAQICCVNCWKSQYVLYSDNCHSCQYLLGCANMKRKRYCILNKQYSKEEYEKIVPRIIEHMRSTEEWGEFFSMEVSVFLYNETAAQEWFPLTKEQILHKGWRWKEPVSPNFSHVTKKISTAKLPDTITNVPDDVLNWALICSQSNRLFKIQKSELEFYRAMNIPLPRMHPDIRHQKRMKLRNPRKLWNRNCMKCEKNIQTTYAPDRPEIVYCEQCYLQHVY